MTNRYCATGNFEVVYTKSMPLSNIIKEVANKLVGRRLFYVCRDVERAEGLDFHQPGIYIITNKNSYSSKLAKRFKNIILIDNPRPLDTRELLTRKKTLSLLKKGDFVLVFKNNIYIEELCADHGWALLNPSAKFCNEVEEKISQVRWLGPLASHLPSHRIDLCANLVWKGKPFIVQFNRSHTGLGTILVESKKQLQEIREKFPRRDVRVTEYIKGPLFTNNNVVWGNRVFVGNISYQITGLKPFTDMPFATIGNDWSMPRKILTEEQAAQYKKIAIEVGERLASQGWKGLYGIDAVIDEAGGQVYLVEVNARQPASASFESQLQELAMAKAAPKKRLGGLMKPRPAATTFQAHVAALLDVPPDDYRLQAITNGAQIVQRVTLNIDELEIPRIKAVQSFNIIMYQNVKLGTDLIRVQSESGLMEKHNIFNEVGMSILVGIISAHKNMIWNRPRAGVILIKDDKILLMKRNKYGNEYFAMPGGTVEPNENFRVTAMRETKEETNLDFEIDESKKIIAIASPRREHYFFGKNISGKEFLGGPEQARNNPNNSYQLEWVEVEKLGQTHLLPETLKAKLIKRISTGFPRT
ncbi:NUDIX domain-containing protein [Patescibacteria group bacterium]|nr:MAG: NUDIX domain-containing protein [Patescibacteria group bacterium]